MSTVRQWQLDARRTAVLALHWQVNVVDPGGFFGPMLAAPVAASGVRARARALHVAAREAGAAVVFTRFTVPEGEGSLVRNMAFMRVVAAEQRVFRPDAPGAALVDDVGHDPGADHVSDNQRLSGLAGCDLSTWLADRGVDTLVLTGVATNLTVEQTARHGSDLGFHVVVVPDCTTAVDATTHEASLANLALVCEGTPSADEVLAGLAAPA